MFYLNNRRLHYLATSYAIDYMEYATDGAAQSAWVTSSATPLQSYSESTIKTQGSYALKLEATTDSLNETVTRPLVAPSGGTVTTDGSYTVHTFTSDGIMTFPASGNVEVLVVAGGAGGAGHSYSGAGGAGGLLEKASHAVTSKGYAIKVGAGGTGGDSGGVNYGTDGYNSSFDGIVGIGGGAGADTTDKAGRVGGSGGGGSANSGAGAAATQGNSNGATGYGYAGGTGSDNNGGGGGGAGGVGQDGGADWQVPVAGGLPRSNSITGSAVDYAEGGRGPGGNTIGGVSGAANTGDGGDGGGLSQAGGDGGSGIVIIKYLTSSMTAVDNTKDLTGKNTIKLDARSTGTGSNLQISIHDAGGTTTSHTINIASADTYQTDSWDISGVSDANKDAIDSIEFKILNAGSARDFFIDNIYAE
jgi:hypothetical protein